MLFSSDLSLNSCGINCQFFQILSSSSSVGSLCMSSIPVYALHLWIGQDTNLSYRDIAVQFGVWSSSIERIDKGLIRAKDDIDYPIRMNYHELLNKKAEQIIKLLKTSNPRTKGSKPYN